MYVLLDSIPDRRGSKSVSMRSQTLHTLMIIVGIHYRSDHHRYNMKRRVANLPPVSVTVFNQKVLDKRQETAIMASAKGSVCEVCK